MSIIQRQKPTVKQPKRAATTQPIERPRLVKSPENTARAEQRIIEESEAEQRKKLAIVMGAPPAVFYDGGLRRFLGGALDPKKKNGFKTKKALAEALNISSGWMYQITSPSNPHRIGKKTINKIRKATGLPINVRNQFYLEGVANISDND